MNKIYYFFKLFKIFSEMGMRASFEVEPSTALAANIN